jgi:tRNA(Phe) wybutosine-synthesizing methylase Tyw3
MCSNGNGNALFDRQKKSVLANVDLSRKGSVDEPIEGFIVNLNAHKDLCK